MKRILTIQDISCLGKCSLTAALPILSLMGHETVILPTAILSAHTAFPDYTFCDLTDKMEEIAANWEKQGIVFDAVYTGYLGSEKQAALVQKIISRFRHPDTCVFVDPVLGDFGRLYSGFTEQFPMQMRRLCTGADVIVPNLTEAAWLLGIPYKEECSQEEIQEILKRLSALGVGKVLLTGVSFSEDQVGFMGYDAAKKHFVSYFHQKFPQQFHGTGDVFASVCVGGLMLGMDMEESTRLAADFTLESIRKTALAPDARWYGIHYEAAFPALMQYLTAYKSQKE